MARKRSSVADDLLEIASKLPWWGGVALALVAYAGLGQLAAARAGRPQPVDVLIATVAGLGRYIVPFIFLVGAMLSALGRRKRQALLAAASNGHAASAIDGMSWTEFEMLVGEAFRRKGYRVKETGGGGADGGVDLLLQRDGRTALVQCKHWKVYRVGVPIVREMFGLMHDRGAAEGWVITSGNFTAEAQQFATGKAIILVDGTALAEMLRDARGTSAVRRTSPAPAADAGPSAPRQAQPEPEAEAPKCPRCGLAMVQRSANKGARPGQSFWGCTGFPSCRGTRPIA